MDFSRLLVARPPSTMCVTLKPSFTLLSVGIGAEREDLSPVQGQGRAGVVERYDGHDGHDGCPPADEMPAAAATASNHRPLQQHPVRIVARLCQLRTGCDRGATGRRSVRPRKQTTHDEPDDPDGDCSEQPGRVQTLDSCSDQPTAPSPDQTLTGATTRGAGGRQARSCAVQAR